MFDMFNNYDDIIAAILTIGEVDHLKTSVSRQTVVAIWSRYLELIKQERNDKIDKLKEKYDEIL